VKPVAEQTLYEILEVPSDAPESEIVRAWERAEELYGPDSLSTYTLISPDEATVINAKLEEALNVLLDPAERVRYDARLRARPAHAVRAEDGMAGRAGLRLDSAPLPPIIPPLAAAPSSSAALDRALLLAPVTESAPRGGTLVALEIVPPLEEFAPPDAADAEADGAVGSEDGEPSWSEGGEPSESEDGQPSATSPGSPANGAAPPGEAVLVSEGLHPTGGPDAAPAREAEKVARAMDEREAAEQAGPPARLGEGALPDGCAADAREERDPPPILLSHLAEAPILLSTPAQLSPPFAAALGSSAPAAASSQAQAAAAPVMPEPRPQAPLSGPVALVLSEGVTFTGETLRRVREARGLSVQQICERTRIARHHLENIEAQERERLPAPVYLRGILMALARELRLDGQKVARSYLEAVASQAPASDR
jgi:curved DNA-binding protein CbpA